MQETEFIIKITGRYYIPNFENYLIEKNIMNYDCLRQNNKISCEFLGCKQRLFNQIFNICIEDGHIENVWRDRINKYSNNVLTSDIQKISPTQQGGVNVIRTFL